ncbi:hypothetical protein [Actinomadura sp. GTD37]|uniref:hypothetical protein n=1 Tax=Actinomadura sp. GTD37 TaxID=1778030 RepID=UPI0035C26E3E
MNDDTVNVWIGRFQPFHLGHSSMLLSTLEQLGSPIAVMVIDSRNWAPPRTAGNISQSQHISDKNPLTLWERMTMIRIFLDAEGVSRQISVQSIPRPDIYWDIAELSFPPHRRICNNGRDDFEREKANMWRGRGEEVVVLDHKRWLSNSSTNLKQRLREGGDWRPFLHESTLDYFAAINGPERFSEAI